MHKSDSSGEERVLADRLRREAAAGRPKFSETLHRQLCRAIRHCEDAKPAADPLSVSGRLLRHGLVTALAAAGVLAVALIAWQSIKDDGVPRRASNPSLPESQVPDPAVATDTLTEMDMMGDMAARATEEIGILVESAVTRPHWAYLDQNTKLALEALNSRVPLDAVASLVFADVPTDLLWESPSLRESPKP